MRTATAKLVRLSPVADLEPHQRRMVLAMRKEATAPTLRLSYRRLGIALLAAFVAGWLVGCDATPISVPGVCVEGDRYGTHCRYDSDCGVAVRGRCVHLPEKGQ